MDYMVLYAKKRIFRNLEIGECVKMYSIVSGSPVGGFGNLYINQFTKEMVILVY